MSEKNDGMILGIDVSTYLEERLNGAKYTYGGQEIEPLDLFRQNGVEYMRIRVWNNPYTPDGEPYLAGTCDTDNFINLAKYATEKGYKILLDLHYSDFWADPGKQFIPKAWQGLGLSELCVKVKEFTNYVLQRAKDEGIEVALVQVGNEITNGMLWPVGRLTESVGGEPRGNYQSLTKLVKAGIEAVRETAPNAKVIIHLERSYDQQIYNEYFTQFAKYGVDYDIIGMSYYPYWHGTFEQFFANVEMCKKFGKQIMVMELGYAFTLENYILTENGTKEGKLVVGGDNIESFNLTIEYPLTPQGQAEFVSDFLARASRHGVKGVFYWEPLWIPGKGICWASEKAQEYINETGKPTANEWANQCLFDYEGKALPALDRFTKRI